MKLGCLKYALPVVLAGSVVGAAAVIGGALLAAKVAAVALIIFALCATVYGLKKCLCRSVAKEVTTGLKDQVGTSNSESEKKKDVDKEVPTTKLGSSFTEDVSESKDKGIDKEDEKNIDLEGEVVDSITDEQVKIQGNQIIQKMKGAFISVKTALDNVIALSIYLNVKGQSVSQDSTDCMIKIRYPIFKPSIGDQIEELTPQQQKVVRYVFDEINKKENLNSDVAIGENILGYGISIVK